jgi:putative endonuclease
MYILNGNLYIGSTNDLRKRVIEHNKGKVLSTDLRKPLELVYYEAYRSDKDARHREKNLKLRSRALEQLKRRLVESLSKNN